MKLLDGTVCATQTDIQQEAVSYYASLFTGQSTIVDNTLLSYIPRLITTKDNLQLTRMPIEEEVKQTVWALDPQSAANPDGYNGCFFSTCWEIIHGDVYKFV